jgi:4-hydroxybenzoyl-CoA reductase subunit beta
MSLPRFELLRPSSVAEAAALAGPDTMFVAGGTDLFVRLKRRLNRPARLISLAGIDELGGLTATAGEIRIGAGVTLAQITGRAEEDPAWRPLAQVAKVTASPLLRNAGTVGGNLCLDNRCYFFNQPPIFRARWEPCFKLGGGLCHVVRRSTRCHAVYSGDLAGPLTALGATVVLAGSGGTRRLPLAELFSGEGVAPHLLLPGEILTEVRISDSVGPFAFSYQKLRLRDTIDFPLAGVSIYLEFAPGESGTRCREARVVLNALAPAPQVVEEAARLLRGRDLTAEELTSAGGEVGEVLRQAARPVSNTASTPRYRRDMVPVLAQRALSEAMTQVTSIGGVS